MLTIGAIIPPHELSPFPHLLGPQLQKEHKNYLTQ